MATARGAEKLNSNKAMRYGALSLTHTRGTFELWRCYQLHIPRHHDPHGFQFSPPFGSIVGTQTRACELVPSRHTTDPTSPNRPSSEASFNTSTNSTVVAVGSCYATRALAKHSLYPFLLASRHGKAPLPYRALCSTPRGRVAAQQDASQALNGISSSTKSNPQRPLRSATTRIAPRTAM